MLFKSEKLFTLKPGSQTHFFLMRPSLALLQTTNERRRRDDDTFVSQQVMQVTEYVCEAN